ncbi:MAG: HD domain-containing protein [Lachnospiraceae bacterium]|nr:HD domain-containing protein [Lachnospiraceae bacterium]
MLQLMIVDSSEIELKVMTKALEKEYSIITMNNPKQAYGRLIKSTSLPEIVIIDIDSGLGCLELINNIRTNTKTKDIAIIALSGDKNGTTEIESYRFGAAEFVFKPINTVVLKKRVEIQAELVESKRQLSTSVGQLQQNVNFHAQNSLRLEYFLIGLITELLSKKDGFTGRHCVNTSRYMGILLKDILLSGVNYGIKMEDYEIIVLASQLFDMGKMGVPDSVLQKEGKYTDEEFAAMKGHPVYAADAIQKYSYLLPNNDFMIYIYQMARYHHERWDGNGYPDRLSGNNIPILARILAVAEVYDALINKRSYRQAITHEQAYNIIVQGAGTQFDPQVVVSFQRTHLAFYEMTRQIQMQMMQQAQQMNQAPSLMTQSQQMTRQWGN